MCILATNIATEKVFIFLWFWFIILFIITFIAIGYYCILFFSRDVAWRDHFLAIAVNSTKVDECFQSEVNLENQEFQGARNGPEKEKEERVHIFLKNLPAAKFFFLYMIGHNVDYLSLKEIVQKITDIVSGSI